MTAPLNELYDSMKRHERIEVHTVSEFRTSKRCPRCHKDMVFPKKQRGKKRDRFCYCQRCRVTYNRDLAAPENIIKNGISQVARLTDEDLAKERAVKNMFGKFP